jgi:Glyoxalase-like domain
VRIDHVIYGTSDLDAAAARMSEFGLDVQPGGRHEGLGTHNRIVPLADAYIELLAIADPDEAASSALGRAVAAGIAAGDGLLSWVVRVESVTPVAERLGTAVTTIARQGMSAHLTGLAEALAEPYLPFFIARDPGVPGPPETGPAPLAWIEVAGDGDKLHEWLGGAELPVRVVDGPPAVLAVGIGDRELR